jgi:hypothetical protein
MKSLKSFFIVIILIFFLPQIDTIAQELADSSSLWVIDTEDGNTFMGRILNEDSIQVVLLTDVYGTVLIPTSRIKQKKELKQTDLIEGQHWFSNPHATRYFFGTNGYGLRKGEAYYQNTWILFNQINYGISNHISLGGGMVPLFLFAGAPTPVFITPKLTLPLIKDKLNLGAGVLYAYVLGEEFGFGITYGTITLGNRDSNLTLGGGWAFADAEWASSPTLTLNGMTRVGRKTYLVTENYYIGLSEDSSFGIISLGGRSVQKKLAVDYGLFFPVGADIGSFLAIPWLGIAVPFGNTQ